MNTVLNVTPSIVLLRDSHELKVLDESIPVSNQTIKLENVVAKVLQLLLKHKNEVVHRKKFIEEIWEGNALVGEPALTKSISKIRKMLKKMQPGTEKMIDTLPKIGYRLNAGSDSKASRTKLPILGRMSLSKIKTILFILILIIIILKLLFPGFFHPFFHRVSH